MQINGIESDAWSNGQIQSKLWLCKELEKVLARSYSKDGYKIALLGGWYGMTGFLMLTRDRLNIKYIRSYDIDPACEKIADMVNENWVFQEWKFKAFTEDANKTNLEDFDFIINTSAEHFESNEWFENIPEGKVVIVQANNMKHDDHLFQVESIEAMKELFPMSRYNFAGGLDFKYPDWQFTRFMLIGRK